MPLKTGRIPPGAMDSRQWASFVARAGIQADRTVKTFTPTSWDGFSVDPVGSFSYQDFGAIVTMWRNEFLVGTSDDTFMTLSGIPLSIRPTSPRVFRCYVVDNGIVFAGNALIDPDGDITFSLEVVAGSKMIYDSNGFTAAADKGIPFSWLIMYAK